MWCKYGIVRISWGSDLPVYTHVCSVYIVARRLSTAICLQVRVDINMAESYTRLSTEFACRFDSFTSTIDKYRYMYVCVCLYTNHIYMCVFLYFHTTQFFCIRPTTLLRDEVTVAMVDSLTFQSSICLVIWFQVLSHFVYHLMARSRIINPGNEMLFIDVTVLINIPESTLQLIRFPHFAKCESAFLCAVRRLSQPEPPISGS